MSLEHLEAREVPANYYWAPPADAPDPQFTTITHWMKGPGVPWDRYTTGDSLPGPTADLYFVGGLSSKDCVIPDQTPTAPSKAFNGIHLLFGTATLLEEEEELPGEGGPPVSPPPPPSTTLQPYSGTVTIADSLAVGTLEVDCGAIKQADPNASTGSAGTLTINSSLDWTGGTLNSNTTAGVIALAPGAIGVAAPSETNPGINETVQLGSELRLMGDVDNAVGSSLTIKNGVFNLVNGFFRAIAPSLLTLAPVPKYPPPSTPGTPSITLDNQKVENPAIRVDTGSTLTVATVGRQNGTDKVDVKVSGSGVEIHNQGTVNNKDYTRVIMTKKANANFVEFTQNRAILFDPPVTNLQAGSEIKFESNGNPQKGCFNLTEGELRVSATSADELAAAITAPANPTAPALFVGVDGKVVFDPCSFLTKLALTGDFTCEGEMYLRATRSSGTNDQITATGLMRYQTGQGAGHRTAKVFVDWVPMSGDLPANDTEWELLVSVGANGAIVTQPNATIPTVNPPDTLTAGPLPAPKKYGMTFDKK